MKKKQKEETKSIRAIYEGQKTCQDFLKNFNFFFCHFCKFSSDSFGEEVSSSSCGDGKNKNLSSDISQKNLFQERLIPETTTAENLKQKSLIIEEN